MVYGSWLCVNDVFVPPVQLLPDPPTVIAATVAVVSDPIPESEIVTLYCTT